MKMPTVIILSTAILLFSASAAHGQTQSDLKAQQSAEATFKSLDRNRDEELSKVEAKADASLWAAFASADVNLNGYITKSEYVAYIQRSTSPQPPAQQ